MNDDFRQHLLKFETAGEVRHGWRIGHSTRPVKGGRIMRQNKNRTNPNYSSVLIHKVRISDEKPPESVTSCDNLRSQGYTCAHK